MKQSLIYAVLGLLFTLPAHADGWKTYRVTITNATSHQVLTPPLIAVHKPRFQVFNVGDTASYGLLTQAETGNPSELALELQASPGVLNVTTGSDVIPYGQSASFVINAPKRTQISITSMLASTNDGFAAIKNISLPKRSRQFVALAYDAGSEMNNETCTHVPGPPCTPESGNLRTDTGEGFISIHNGIHGGSDLNPKHLDWRGPVAVVTITRITD
ncbi:MAG: spondin domain-containing protein [Thioalkalispiraceae bacterium]|jgi:hypothetical protein